MNNNDNNFDFSDLIPLDELGVNTKDCVVNAKHWYDTTYNMYKDSCHSPRNQDERETMEKYVDADKINEHTFCVWGKKCCFRWYALTLFYNESIHEMDNIKELHNMNHYNTLCNPATANPVENIAYAINSDDNLLNILRRKPIVANTQECFNIDHLTPYYNLMCEFTVRLNVFLNQGPICSKVFNKKGEGYYVDKNTIVGKDVVLPFIWADSKNLDVYGYLAKTCIDYGANTAVGIFASRLVPTMDGRESYGIPNEYWPSSFSPRWSYEV